MVNILTDIEVHEVSLVDKGANGKRIIYKSADDVSADNIQKGDIMSEKIAKETSGPDAIDPERVTETSDSGVTDPERVTEIKEDKPCEEDEPCEKEEEDVVMSSDEEEKEDDEEEEEKSTRKSARRSVKARKSVDSDRVALRKALEEKRNLEKRLYEVEKRLKEETDRRVMKEFVEKARGEYSRLGSPEEVAAVLKQASERLDPDIYGKLVNIFATANNRIDETLFREIGKSGDLPGSGVYDKIRHIAKSLMEKDPALTYVQAEAKAWEMNPDLYMMYYKEYANRVS